MAAEKYFRFARKRLAPAVRSRRINDGATGKLARPAAQGVDSEELIGEGAIDRKGRLLYPKM
jgi:hypothetical protein